MSAHARPRASSSPRRWLRDSGDPHVAITSPIPARPAKVSGLAPAAMPSRVISARPRVISPALPLSPNPSPSAAPAAMATTFLSAPHNSTPRMSLVHVEPELAPAEPGDDPFGERQVRRGDDGRRRQAARDLGRQVGPGQGGDARPARTPPASAMTSLIRSSVPGSRPLTTDRTSAAGSRCGATRRDGRAKVGRRRRRRRRGRPQPRMAVGSAVATRRRRQVDARAAARSFRRDPRDPCGRRRRMAQQGHRLALGDDRWRGSSPTPRLRRRRPAARTSARLARSPGRPARRGPLPDPTGALRSFLRRGNLTELRSRNTSRIGVPSNPNVSRRRFSR